jgi:hypothetical protein
MVDLEKTRMNKPTWAIDPELLDFKVVNEPLEKLLIKTIRLLERKAKDNFNEFDFLTEKILFGCFQTYKSIRKLVAKDPKYPTQAHILNRSILDSIFVIEAFVENPEKFPRAYALAGFRMIWEEYKKEQEKYRNNPQWDGYLSYKVKLLKFSSQIFGLTTEEIKSPKRIKYWPIPSKMLKEKIFSLERQKFLEQLYEWHYGWESALSHFQWGGMSASVFSSFPEHHWHPGKFESDAVYRSILYLLMILSEIESFRKFGLNEDLKYIWTIVGNYSEEAKDYYEIRFGALL